MICTGIWGLISLEVWADLLLDFEPWVRRLFLLEGYASDFAEVVLVVVSMIYLIICIDYGL